MISLSVRTKPTLDDKKLDNGDDDDDDDDDENDDISAHSAYFTWNGMAQTSDYVKPRNTIPGNKSPEDIPPGYFPQRIPRGNPHGE